MTPLFYIKIKDLNTLFIYSFSNNELDKLERFKLHRHNDNCVNNCQITDYLLNRDIQISLETTAINNINFSDIISLDKIFDIIDKQHKSL